MTQKQRDRLVTENYGFAISLARQYVGQGLVLDDLVSEASVGLVKAAQHFDPDKGQEFVQYAVWHIRQHIERALGQEQRQTGMQVNKEERVNRSVSSSVSDEDSVTASMLEHIEEKMTTLNQREQLVIAAYYGINCNQMSMAEIGEAMHLKRERIRQIRKTAERKLRRAKVDD